MEKHTKEIFLTIKNKVKEYKYILMVVNILDNGETIKNKDKEL